MAAERPGRLAGYGRGWDSTLSRCRAGASLPQALRGSNVIRIQRIEPGSIAADLDLPIGMAVVSINEKPIRDGLDLLFYQAEGSLRIEAEPVSFGYAADCYTLHPVPSSRGNTSHEGDL